MRISYRSIWSYLVALICVIPVYANIGTVSISNILLALFYFISLLWYGISPSEFKYSIKAIPFLSIFLLTWVIQSIADSTISIAAMNIFQRAAFLIVVSMSLKTEKHVDCLINSLITISFPLCILGVFEELTSVNVFSELFGGGKIYSDARRMGLTRIYSAFTHPISYGIFLTMIAVLILYMINKNQNRKLYVNLILVFVNLCFTVSRSIIVSGLAAVLLMMTISGMLKLTKKRIFLLMIIVALIFVSPILFPNVLNFFSEIFRSVVAVFNSNVAAELGSAEGNRKDLYAWTLYALQGHYLFGKGTTAVFRYVVASYTWGDTIKNSLENQYLYIFFLHGIVGLITYILSMLNILVFSIKGVYIMNAVFVIVVMYIVMLFATAESSENTMWYVVLAIGIATKKIMSIESGENI